MGIVTIIRKGSKGINGTFENIDHHAKDARIIVEIISQFLLKSNHYYKQWKQGHNIHQVITHDDRVIVFRPHRPTKSSGINGVQVLLYVSRTVEVPLFSINSPKDAYEFCIWFEKFSTPAVNWYGLVKEKSEAK